MTDKNIIRTLDGDTLADLIEQLIMAHLSPNPSPEMVNEIKDRINILNN